MAVMLSDLLRYLTFNRSAHCTQVSDQCPLGLLFYFVANGGIVFHKHMYFLTFFHSSKGLGHDWGQCLFTKIIQNKCI